MTPSSKTQQQQIFDTTQQAADACARFFQDTLSEVLQSQPRATIALSGGSSPRLIFATLAKSGFDWSNVHFFWVDERCVPPSDDQSNFKLANETLLRPARVPKNNIHRIQGELLPDEGAENYIKDIETFFALKDHALPMFDLIHRGIGPDAHTASLFPGEPLIDNRTGIAAAVWVEKLKSHRVTVLPGVLLAARRTVILAAGDDKSEAVRNTLKGPEDPHKYPCQIATRGSNTATWFLDKAAASKL